MLQLNWWCCGLLVQGTSSRSPSAEQITRTQRAHFTHIASPLDEELTQCCSSVSLQTRLQLLQTIRGALPLLDQICYLQHISGIENGMTRWFLIIVFCVSIPIQRSRPKWRSGLESRLLEHDSPVRDILELCFENDS